MCGRYHITASPRRVQAAFELPEVPAFDLRYNAAPTQAVPVVRAFKGRRALALLRWGLVPAYWKGLDSGPLLINARAETVMEKSSFAGVFERQRCLIPSDGFYEWQQGARGKQPVRFTLQAHEVYAMAGVWDRWTAHSGVSVESCAVITVPANADVAPVHDRMPAILPRASYTAWLAQDTPAPAAQGLLHSLPDGLLRARLVSSHVNHAGHDDPLCLAPPDGVQAELF